MAEAMSDARLAEIRDEVTGPCSCCGYDKHDFDEPYALELLAEVDRLRAQLAEIGETREEYAVLSSEGHEAFCATPQGALRIAKEWTAAKPGAPWQANRRLVGQWREVPDA